VREEGAVDQWEVPVAESSPIRLLSEILRSRKGAIIHEWERVARDLAGHLELALPGLVGSMEELLERVASGAEALEDGSSSAPPGAERPWQRLLEQGLDLGRIAAEYAALREVIGQQSAADDGAGDAGGPMRTTGPAIDAAVAVSIAAFVERENESELEEALRSRDEMMEIVSHDLRNLLNAVTFGAATLGTTDLSQEAFLARTSIDTIARSAQAMKRLIDDLLDLASIRSRRLSMEAAPQDGAALLGESLACLEATAREKRVALRAEIEGILPAVKCDRDRILQVFSNLISNAVQATAPGGSIVLRARADKSEVTFSVSDTGRHSTQRAFFHLRAVLARPGRSLPGGGAGPGDRQGAHRGPRRTHLGRERRGPGQLLLLHVAHGGRVD
jgi:signal transduction histidine kinase